MSGNSSIISDVGALCYEELIEEYKRLSVLYKTAKDCSETDKQQIHELKRNLQISIAAQEYVSNELESITVSHTKDIDKLKHKFDLELEDIKSKMSELNSTNASFEYQNEELKKEIKHLNEQLEAKLNQPDKSEDNKSNPDSDKELELIKENVQLSITVESLEEKLNIAKTRTTELIYEVESLTNKIECLEENLQNKKDELEEKEQSLIEMHEKLIELTAELTALKTSPEDSNRKGNSLFAEVDDQRQKMKQLLANQKKHYSQMQKAYIESEYEIRKLKRENAAMHKELKACSSIFLNADKTYKDKLNEKLMLVVKQNEELQKKLNWTEDKLTGLAINKGIMWLDSMLSYCKNETEQLKKELHSCRLQKSQIDENYHQSQQELAKWRFECLKEKCIIINRETLLEEHNIPFQPQKNVDIDFDVKISIAHLEPSKKDAELQTENKIVGGDEHLNEDRNDSIIEIFEDSHDEKIHGNVNLEIKNESDTTSVSSNCSLTLTSMEKEILKNPKSLESDFDIYEDSMLEKTNTSKPTDLSPNSTEAQPISNDFNIYEDTFCGSLNISKTDSTAMLSKKNKENNATITNNESLLQYRDITVNQSLLQESNHEIVTTATKENNDNFKKPLPSILIKEKDITGFMDKRKSVKFTECTQDSKVTSQGEMKEKAKQNRCKSQITVKRIVIKSQKPSK